MELCVFVMGVYGNEGTFVLNFVWKSLGMEPAGGFSGRWNKTGNIRMRTKWRCVRVSIIAVGRQ